MGAAMCGFRKRSSKGQGQQNQENEADIVKNTWPKCLGKPKKKKKMKPCVLTLQDVIAPSPHSNKGREKSLNTNNGGDIFKMVFRSQAKEAIRSDSRGNLRVERDSNQAVKVDTGDVRVVEERMLSRGENEESSSKRVRFMLPPLGDIIVVDSRYRAKLVNSNKEGDISHIVFPSPVKDHGEAISSISRDNLGSDRGVELHVELDTYVYRVVDERILSRGEENASSSKRVRFKLPALRDIL